MAENIALFGILETYWPDVSWQIAAYQKNAPPCPSAGHGGAVCYMP